MKKVVLLPIFSLPSKYGIGDFGCEAYEFIKILKENDIDYWEILPINEAGQYPYSPISFYALNKNYISIDKLIEMGLLESAEEIPSCDKIVYDNYKGIDYFSYGFLLKAEEGVYIATHWLLHNYIKKDRYKPSVELARDKIWILENRQYTLEEKGTKLTEFYDDEVKSKKRVTSEKKRKVSDEVKDEIWSAYPKKSGKTAAFKSLDSILSKYTKEEILRCVERYCKERKKEIESGDMQYILMGSSFFSNKGRWKDYLDENYDDSSSKSGNLNKGNKAYIEYYE